MSDVTATPSRLSRRRFLRFSAVSGGVLALAACGGAAEPAATALPPTPVPPAPDPTATPVPVAAEAVEAGEVEVMAGDVIDYILESDDWAGPYGQVRFQMHEALHNGEAAHYIRTDAGDQAFSQEAGLVFVPLLNTAAGLAEDEVNTMFTFGDDRPTVIRYIPGDEMYSSLFRLASVELADSSTELGSYDDVMAAIEDGSATLAEGNLFVNYPLIQWGGGGMSVDPDLEGVLPGGQLFEEPDTENMIVSMKLHQCYPGSRYILTDTGAVPMAPMMNIPASAPTNKLKDLGGADEIWVFGNGLEGPGVMGFQPAIFDNKAGQPAWSPFWDHFTLTWNDGVEPRLMTNSEEVRAAIAAEEVTQWNGVPDSHPNGFVVNCPAPILAPNTYGA